MDFLERNKMIIEGPRNKWHKEPVTDEISEYKELILEDDFTGSRYER